MLFSKHNDYGCGKLQKGFIYIFRNLLVNYDRSKEKEQLVCSLTYLHALTALYTVYECINDT